jgi:cysteine desulfuration protein SufE
MSNAINKVQDQIILDFSSFETWEKKYNYLIKLGKNLNPMQDQDKTEALKVKGCQSQVWLKASLGSEGRILFVGDSDAVIVRGLVALLILVYSDRSPEDILATPPYFIEKIELAQHLSASRTNGLNSMIKQIKYYAQAFSLMSKR